MGARPMGHGAALFEARMRVCLCLRTRVCVEGNKHLGTIHQLSTCNQRFGGLMTVRFNDHRPPSIPDGIPSYQKKGGSHVDKDMVM